MTPRPSAAFWFFAAATTAALVALFWSAVDAFSLTMERNHAIIAAFAFELSAVAEAVALARARKPGDYPIPLLFIILSVVGSGVYNFAQVRNHAQTNGITDPLFLSVFALGPLLAMVGLAMNTGRELRKWEDAKEAHAKAQAQAAANEAAAKARAEDNTRYDAMKAQERAAQRQHELELARLQAEAQSRATAQFAPVAVGGGDVQAEAQHEQHLQPQQPQRLRGAQLRAALAEWRNANPDKSKADAARAFGVDPATITRNWQ